MEAILEVRGLQKEYEGFSLRNISFDLPRGYIMGLVGPNGAGKTTIIKLILNLIRRDGGAILVFGKDNIRHEVEIKARIGFVHEAPAFYDYLSMRRIKSLVGPFYPAWDDGVFEKLARRFALPLDKKLKAASRGTQMKFALALALAHDADLLILDEPTAGLDPVFRLEFLDMLSGLIQDGNRSVLFSTHITSDLDKTADFITFIRNGELVFSTTKDEVHENWGIVKGGKELLDQEARAMFKGIRIGEFGFEALTADIKQAKLHFANGAVFEKASLEDIVYFMSRRSSDIPGSK